MLLDFVVRKGVVYVPTLAKTEAGFYRTVEPVAVVELSDTQALKSALKGKLLEGNPLIPTPEPGTQRTFVLLKYSAVKSLSRFDKDAAYWTISEENGVYEFGPLKRRKDRGWEEDSKAMTQLPPGSSVDDVTDAVVESVQSSLK